MEQNHKTFSNQSSLGIELTPGFRRLPSYRKPRRRIVFKSGKCNISKPKSNLGLRRLQFAQIVDASWTTTITTFIAIISSSAMLFAVIYWLICFTHGDFEPDHLPEAQKQNNFLPCVYDIHSFWSCVLFSIETQHTVGYGIKATTVECPEAIFVNSLQCNLGYIMQGIMAVIVFSKMTLPRLRSQTLLFSKRATIALHGDHLCLMFRMGDMRKNHIIDARVRVYYVRSVRTIEGEVLEHHQVELPVVVDNCKTGLFFNWPLVVVHQITNESVLYRLTPNDLSHDSFEIVVLLEGGTHTTEQMIQARTSYLPSEIVWGHKFQDLITFNVDRKQYQADFSKFDLLVPVGTPACSAAQLHGSEPQETSTSGSSSVSSTLQIGA